MLNILVTFSLIALAAFSRLLPHPPNVTAITALALFGGVYLQKRQAFVVPLAAMLLSDYILGFYRGMEWVYASFVAIGFIGLWLRRHHGVGQTIAATLSGSVLFFVVTNFGVWVSSQVVYPHTVTGLVECYIAAIPFFRNTLAGDLIYVGVMFGAYELLRRFVPSLGSRPEASGA